MLAQYNHTRKNSGSEKDSMTLKKFTLTLLLAFGICITPLLLFCLPHEKFLLDERRKSIPFPDFPSTITYQNMKSYVSDISASYKDHFPGRSVFLRFIGFVTELSKDNVDPTLCLRGKDNWLFLGDSYQNSIRKLQGELVPNAKNIQQATQGYKELASLAKTYGADYLLLIGPDKPSIYPEYLPAIIQPSANKYITPFIQDLRSAGLMVHDPTAELWQAKPQGLLYYRGDTHWNQRGSGVAVAGVLRLLKLSPLPAFRFVQDSPYEGVDLPGIAAMPSWKNLSGDNFRIIWEKPSQVRLTDKTQPSSHAGEWYKGGHYINPDAPNPQILWVVGDSFTRLLVEYFTAAFAETRYFNANTHNADTLAELLRNSSSKPDLIISVAVERSF